MLRKIVVGPYQSNCYVLGCKKTMEGLVIDPGDEVFRIVKTIAETGLKIRYILITHGHIDHVGGAAELKKNHRGPGLHSPAGYTRPGISPRWSSERRKGPPTWHIHDQSPSYSGSFPRRCLLSRARCDIYRRYDFRRFYRKD